MIEISPQTLHCDRSDIYLDAENTYVKAGSRRFIWVDSHERAGISMKRKVAADTSTTTIDDNGNQIALSSRGPKPTRFVMARKIGYRITKIGTWVR